MRLQQILRQLAADEEGASLVEYSILAGLVTAGAVALIKAVGQDVFTAWEDLWESWNCADRRRALGVDITEC